MVGFGGGGGQHSSPHLHDIKLQSHMFLLIAGLENPRQFHPQINMSMQVPPFEHHAILRENSSPRGRCYEPVRVLQTPSTLRFQSTEATNMPSYNNSIIVRKSNWAWRLNGVRL